MPLMGEKKPFNDYFEDHLKMQNFLQFLSYHGCQGRKPEYFQMSSQPVEGDLHNLISPHKGGRNC